MTRTPRLVHVATVAALSVVVAACPSVRDPQLVPASQPAPRAPAPLKVHLMSGDLLVLDSWREAAGDSGIFGAGARYDPSRRHSLPFQGLMSRDSIALYEQTRTHTVATAGSGLLIGYTVLTGLVTAICVADPKSCFGSCPTFYLDGDRPAAEGFSASVAHSLEATDVDDLGDVHRTGRRFDVVMKNEALETHAVRFVRLLVTPRLGGGHLVHGADGRFYRASDESAPTACSAGDDDCGALLAARDGREWFTRADSTDLAAPDSIDLVFASTPAGDAGLIVAARQAFVSTFVFYQTLAYAGTHAGDLLAEVERRGITAFPGAWTMMQRLARVDVLAGPDGGTLEPVGRFGEPGPIATDQQMIPLPPVASGRMLHVRLRFARGAWRFDRVALARFAAAPDPIRLEPVRVEQGGADTAALARLLDPDRYLVTEPGDAYRLVFELPQDAAGLEFFLESRGYYYEWMRPEWLREEDPVMLGLLATRPDEALRRMAPAYARLEPRLEEMFWASRFEREVPRLTGPSALWPWWCCSPPHWPRSAWIHRPSCWAAW